jgi:hypothetical protein
VKDQYFFSNSAFVELGFAASRTDSRSIPQGDSPYLITPAGRLGNSFVNARRAAYRDQGFANGYLPSFKLLGEHRIKTGLDMLHLAYDQNIQRSGVDYVGLDGAVLRSIGFTGFGQVSRGNTVASVYVQDSWRIFPHLIVDMGFRIDRDQLLGNTNMSPRAGVAWYPKSLNGTRFSAGFARIFDPTDLRQFVRPLDQSSVTTYFNPAGTVLYGPIISMFKFGASLRNPRADIWNLAVEKTFPAQVQARLQLLRRRSSRGFEYDSSIPASQQLPAILNGAPNPGPLTAVYYLNNGRLDSYDSVEISVRQPLRRRFEWMFSYTFSRAISNGVFERSIDQPLAVANTTGPLPWDAPNRVMTWGYVPAWFKNTALAYVLNWHTGFPFFLQDPYGQLVGHADDHRLVDFFELNLFVEREITVRKYMVALRMGFNNIIGRQNSTVVDNVIGGPTFLHQYGGQSRAFNVRLRFLGKQ